MATSARMVRMVSNQVANRLCRSQPRTPVSVIGGGRLGRVPGSMADIGMSLTAPSSSLHQSDALVEPVQHGGDREAHCQVEQHQDGDALDGAAGLVLRCADDGE